ncbi:MAG: leucine--tRNA ligase [Elusimicrobiota bacterium]
MSTYNFQEIEPKWRKYWEDTGIFAAGKRDKAKKKYYCLVMFPYPSGKLHMGHVRNYVLGDVFANFQRMKGFQVMHPIGWDAFGLPSENAAIKNNIHPEKWTRDNIEHMTVQLKALGISYDWSREFATCDPEYYKWNQWFFIKMWEKGLAFRKKARVNWCPSCQTVLANEQVNQGTCWRCDSGVEDRELEQWFFKITDYAERLLAGHELIKDGWPQEVLLMQKNWIGKSYGAEVDFTIESGDGSFSKKIRIFTTRPDTLFGATFMVLSPEHAFLKELKTKIRNWKETEEYIHASAKKTPAERMNPEKLKTGVKLEGIRAVNPVNKAAIPVFIADYVLMEYGTGAIMAVPAHDQRDWEFATKFKVPIIEVIRGEGSDISKHAYENEGTMVNSGQFNGMPSPECVEKISLWLQQNGLGKKSVNYRLKEWLLSRQRYWGTPIPMIHCDKCGIVPVPEKDLPVTLPKDVKLTGVGRSPLDENAEFITVKCPKCGGKAKRETDTMDTFVDSSWYYARYCDPKNSNEPVDRQAADAWLPVDQYVGGIEHACMHLIYSRFWHKVMKDIGLVSSEEPFTKLLTQGMVTLGGSAMSKSKGNIVTPDEITSTYGSDTLRLFIMFASPPEKQLDWSSDGVEGSWRFTNRVWRLHELIAQDSGKGTGKEEALLHKMHLTVKKVTDDIAKEQQLNTAISSTMELVNELYASLGSCGAETLIKAYKTVVLLLAPFTPHLCEELWQKLGNKESILTAEWPEADQKYLKTDTIEIPVQINGKLRGKITVPSAINEAELNTLIMKDAALKPHIENKQVAKFIYVPGKIANIVVK